MLGLLRAPVLLSRPTPPHVPPISPRARAAPSPRPLLGGWVTVGVTVADAISGHPGPSPLCHRHTRALLSHEFVRLHAKMSSLLKLFFEDSSSDDDDEFEMVILSLFAATMSNKRPKHCGSLRRRALVCRKKSRHAKLTEDQSQLPTRGDQSSHCHLAASSRVSSRRRQIGFAKECVTEMPRALLDCRPCKQPRLGWDVGPAEMHQMAFSDDDDILDQWLEQEESDDDDYYIAAALLADVEHERSKKHCDSVPGRQVQIGLCGQEVVNAISAVELGFSSDAIVSSHVNQEQPRDESPPLREDDKYGRYVFAVGDNLTSRYRINAKMGQGTFGQVLECWDRERKEMVAIKITRGTKTYRDAAMIEIGMLEQLGKYDKSRSSYVQIRNWFDYRNHICIVFEKLGPSLCDFLWKNNYRSFPIALVREVAKQLLECVAFMHELRLIHTDLKPENILLVSPECIKVPDYKASFRSPKEGTYYKWLPKSNAIKVIDFGSTTYDRQIRVMWYPLGIIGLQKLYWGEALFQTGENLEHLAMMERVFGHLPYHMLKMADRHSAKYIKEGRLNWPGGCTSWERMKAVTKLPRLQSLVMRNVDQSAGDIIDLLQGLLEYDPANRLTAQEALRHPFFTEEF